MTRKRLDTELQNAFFGKIPKGNGVKDMYTNFLTSLLCFESFKKSGVVVTLVLFIDFQWNRTFLFALVCLIGVFGQGMVGEGGWGWKGKKDFHLALSATITQEGQLSYIQTLSSDFVINSYGESWDSSCEKSWVPVQNQWIPVKKKWVRNWKFLGLYVTRQLI